jgi:hypothetical protein
MFGRRFLLVVLLAGLAPLSRAADRKASIREGSSGASISSPIVGYFWSETDGLASVDGVPGAAHVGPSSPLVISGNRVALPPGQAYVWVEGLGSIGFVIALDGTGHGSVPAGSDLISFSPDGKTAVLFSRTGGVRIASGLPGSPQVSDAFAAPQGDCGALAVADDATTVLLACGSNLYSATADRVWKPVMPGQTAAVSFLPGSSDALAIMVGDPAVYGVSLDAQNAGVRAQLPNGMNDPVALAVSADGRFGVAIDGSGNAAQLDLLTSQTALFQVAQGMRTVQRGREASTFLLIPDGGGVPWIVEARPGNPSVSFAPRIFAPIVVTVL